MENISSLTKQAQLLYEELTKRGLKVEKEYWDGHKHIDLAILSAKLFIEVDGSHHFTDPIQIQSDFKRDHFSDGDDFDTFRVPNIILKHYFNETAEAIARVVEDRLKSEP